MRYDQMVDLAVGLILQGTYRGDAIAQVVAMVTEPDLKGLAHGCLLRGVVERQEGREQAAERPRNP